MILNLKILREEEVHVDDELVKGELEEQWVADGEEG
jgi:hypothetical protein